MTIPVFGVPCLNRVDLLEQMLLSIDEPVERLYVIDNGGVVPDDIACPSAQSIRVVHPGFNLGVARSWNFIVEAHVLAPWWFIANVDIVFAPGALARLVETMAGGSGPRIGTLQAFGAFAINDAAVEAVGWFDENFAPIYYEDWDWCRRAELKDVPVVRIESDTVHVGEQSHRSDPLLTEANARTVYANRERYQRKWGQDADGAAVYRTPFDSGADPAAWGHPPLSLLREQRWAI